MKLSTHTSRLLQSRQEQIRQMPSWNQIIRGTLMQYYRTCGNRGCHCYSSKRLRHGPYWYLSVQWKGGKQKLYKIETSMITKVKDGIRAYHKLWEGVYSIAELNLALLRHAQEEMRK